MQDYKIEISAKSMMIVFVAALAFVFLYAVEEVRAVLFMVAVAIIIASALDPWVTFLQEKKIPRTLSSVLIYIIFILLLLLLFAFLIPSLIIEGKEFFTHVSFFYEENILPIENDFRGLFGFEADGILPATPPRVTFDTGRVFGIAARVFGGIVTAVAIFIISFYLLVREKGIERFLCYVAPRQYEADVARFWGRAQKKISSWFFGQLLLGLIIGTLIFIGLTVLGVKYALVLAVIAAVLELVPYVGPIVATIPAVLVSFSQMPWLGVSVLVMYIIVQQLENHIIVPLVMKKAVGLDPVVVIVSLLLGVKLAGVLGMIIAVPMAAIIVEIIDEVVERRPKRAEAEVQ